MPQIKLLNQEQQTTQVSSYNWKHLTKAGLIFAGTVGAFFTLKATGSFSMIASWLRSQTNSLNTETDALVTVKENPTIEKTSFAVITKEYQIEETHRFANFAELPLYKREEREVLTTNDSSIYSSSSSIPKYTYFNDFSGPIGSEWSISSTARTPAGNNPFLGRFTNNDIELSLTQLPINHKIKIEFDLYIIQSWDGNYDVYGPDIWTLDIVGGKILLYTTFANCGYDHQAYPNNYPEGSNPYGTGAIATNILGYSDPRCTFDDSIYHFNFIFVHTDNSIVFRFSARGLEDISNESWGIDNVSVQSQGELPQLINNDLIITPISFTTIIITPEMLSATDPDDNNTDLIFIISNIQHGQFEYIDNPGIAITSFTQQDIIDGNVQFVRDGSDYLPAYDVSVSDGISATEPTPVTIVFSGVNNVPQLITNELPLYQGQTVTVTQDMLYARDVENEPPDLLFIISDIQYGHFERTDNLGIAITRFTQQEINDGRILFIHDGSSTAPHFYVSVTDYTYTTTPELCNTQLLDVNDVPRFINNQLEVYQGQTVVITPEMLKAGDPDNNDPDLIFTITDLQHSQFEDISNPGVAITSFTQQNIIDGQIQFVQDGSSNTPAYTVTVSDGELSTSSAAIVIGMERITLVKNRLIISDSLQAVLSEAFLKATHVAEDDKSLTFNATAIEHGRFALITDIAAPVTYFLQDKVANRQIYFAHDGSGIAPAYNISVSDGVYATESKAADVMFDTSVVVNDPPRLVTNRLAIQEGATFVLTPNNLKGTNIDSLDANLIFIASDITHGQFALTNNPGVAITSFTQQQIIAQQICFVHDGNENAPSYNIQVSDGDKTITPQAMTVTFTNVNDAPVLRNPISDRLAENPGKSFSFTIADNTFSDAENDPLTLSAKMRTEDVYQPPPDWVEFDTANNRFSGTPVSLGSTRFSIFATDPYNATAQADFSVQVVKPEKLSKGAIAGIVITAGAATSALLGFSLWKYKNHRDEIKRQKQHFLAARIRKHLNLNIQDFTSEQGREFISIIDNLITRIEQRGILVKDMNNKELDALALQLAGIIEDKIIMQKTCLRANKIEIETLNNIAEVIANTVTQHGSRSSIPMQTFMGV